jgi:hypothetical protein
VQNGLNYLLYKVAIEVITSLLQHQIEKGQFPLEILGLEKTLNTKFTFERAGEKTEVQLYGRIDRIDKVGNTIRVIDYKTGRVEKSQLRANIMDVEQTLVTNPEADKVRQLWLYKYILAKRMLHEKGLRLGDRHLRAEDHKLVSGIFSFRNIGEGLMTDGLRFDNNPEESLETFVAQSEVYLQKLISAMLDPDQPFQRTSHIDSCLFCPYTTICGR